jgi:multimeric flavodoxin WrbA
MRLIIHDLKKEDFEKEFSSSLEDTVIISDDESIHNCIGCFGCWVKTPGACVIRDKYADMGKYLSKCREVIIISQCFYGGFSPFVKNVLDRSISYVHPFFKIKNGEMHHQRRYDNNVYMKVWFYGNKITEKEKRTARGIVKANCINLYWDISNITFSNNINELGEQIL